MIRRSLDEIHARACAELWVNPTITVYVVTRDGIELRWPAYPFSGWKARLAMFRLREAMEAAGDAAQAALAKIVAAFDLARANEGGAE